MKNKEKDMQKKTLWKIITFIGTIPFIAPFAAAIWNIYMIHSHPGWTVFEFVFIYSFLYWPTYILGLIAIVLGVYRLKKTRTE